MLFFFITAPVLNPCLAFPTLYFLLFFDVLFTTSLLLKCKLHERLSLCLFPTVYTPMLEP